MLKWQEKSIENPQIEKRDVKPLLEDKETEYLPKGNVRRTWSFTTRS